MLLFLILLSLDENVAESQGKAISDMYLAELDLIKVVEGEKENQGIDLITDEGIGEGCTDTGKKLKF